MKIAIEKLFHSTYNEEYNYLGTKGDINMPNTKSKQATKASKNRILVFAIAVVLIAALIAGIFIFGKSKGKDTTTTNGTTAATTQQTTAQPVVFINPLTGLSGFNQNAVGKRPIAVVVENSPPARPQWGFCSPDIVIEGVTEGGITRMLWLYADAGTIPKVGPTRSARHDFVEMAEGLDAIFFHWGHSIYAQSAFDKRNIDHVDGIYYAGTYFFRDKSRGVAIEHTGYTNGELISKAIARFKFNTQIEDTYADPFNFAPEGSPSTPAGGTCSSISVEFSYAYKHTFKYNANDNLYYNFINSKPMTQFGGKQMAVTNVIILYCPVKLIPGGSGTIDMDLTGGKGVIATNGGYENITWKKGGPTNMLRLYSSSGAQLTLNAGKSYIGWVPTTESSQTVIKGTTETTTS